MVGNTRVFVAIVLVHLGVVGVHSAAHFALGIIPGAVDSAFIASVIVAGPIISVLVMRFQPTLGLLFLAVFLLASFAYGVDNHFLANGPDHVTVAIAQPWTGIFVLTGLAIGALELVGALAALIVMWLRIRIPSGPAAPPG